jgi:hypothetical protein
MQDDFDLLSNEKSVLENELKKLKAEEVGKFLVAYNGI